MHSADDLTSLQQRLCNGFTCCTEGRVYTKRLVAEATPTDFKAAFDFLSLTRNVAAEIQQVWFDFSSIDDDGIHRFCKSAEYELYPNLREISLKHTSTTEVSLKSLVIAKGLGLLPSLEYLYIDSENAPSILAKLIQRGKVAEIGVHLLVLKLDEILKRLDCIDAYRATVISPTTESETKDVVWNTFYATALPAESIIDKAPMISASEDTSILKHQHFRRTQKKSTSRGEARVKLIAALTKHHKYASGSCLQQEYIASNELARQAEVAQSTANDFFNKQFGGYDNYKQLCRDFYKLISALKLLNNEFSPRILFTDSKSEGRTSEGE